MSLFCLTPTLSAKIHEGLIRNAYINILRFFGVLLGGTCTLQFNRYLGGFVCVLIFCIIK